MINLPQATGWIKRHTVHILLVPLVAFGIWTGVRGVNFGKHVDEPHILGTVTKCVQSGLLMKGWYDYPDIPFNVALLCLAPEMNYFLTTRPSDPMDRLKATIVFKMALLEFTSSEAFHMRVRSVFVWISHLSLLWVYLLVLRWRKNWVEALLAAAIMGLSWEFNYHSRWIAPDGIVTQFGALTVLCLVFFFGSPYKRFWLKMAAIAAGLATGTKYPAAVWVVPVWVTAWCYFRHSRRNLLIALAETGGCFIVTYYVTTPGTLLDPIHFDMGAFGAARHYAAGYQGSYGIDAGFTHFFRSFVYLGLVIFSNYGVIAVFLSAAAFAGMASMLRQEKKELLILLSFPVVYLFLMSCQRVMFVRNLIVLLPLLSIFAARGIFFVSGHFLKRRLLRLGLAGIVVVFLTVDAVWIYRASESIIQKDQMNQIVPLGRFLDAHPDQLFYVTPRVGRDLFALDGRARTNITPMMTDRVKGVVFYFTEVKDEFKWPTNRFHNAIAWFGPYHVNYDFYPTWREVERIVVLSPDKARRLEII